MKRKKRKRKVFSRSNKEDEAQALADFLERGGAGSPDVTLNGRPSMPPKATRPYISSACHFCTFGLVRSSRKAPGQDWSRPLVEAGRVLLVR